MYDLGHQVVGVDVAEMALKQFYKENRIEYSSKGLSGDGILYQVCLVRSFLFSRSLIRRFLMLDSNSNITIFFTIDRGPIFHQWFGKWLGAEQVTIHYLEHLLPSLLRHTCVTRSHNKFCSFSFSIWVIWLGQQWLKIMSMKDIISSLQRWSKFMAVMKWPAQ